MPVDIAELARLAEEAREYQQRIGERVFTVRLPTPFEAEQAAVECGMPRVADVETIDKAKPAPRSPAEQAWSLRVAQLLLQRALVAWSNVRAVDLVPSCGNAGEVPPSAEAARLLLDQNPGLNSELLSRFLDEQAKRRAALKAAAGN